MTILLTDKSEETFYIYFMKGPLPPFLDDLWTGNDTALPSKIYFFVFACATSAVALVAFVDIQASLGRLPLCRAYPCHRYTPRLPTSYAIQSPAFQARTFRHPSNDCYYVMHILVIDTHRGFQPHTRYSRLPSRLFYKPGIFTERTPYLTLLDASPRGVEDVYSELRDVFKVILGIYGSVFTISSVVS